MGYKVEFKSQLGIEVRTDNGLKGRLISRIIRINGCHQYVVQPHYLEDDKIAFVDFEDIIFPEDFKAEPQTVEFEFQTGDKIRSRITGKQGFVTAAREDKNGCIHYFYENGEQNPENGRLLEFLSFEQELELVDHGLNKKGEPPVKRKNTGSANIQSSGRR
tara:strand:- start:5806 stop:6288 length:483 start_codon:yes stop_codon:yes gene_type:complete